MLDPKIGLLPAPDLKEWPNIQILVMMRTPSKSY
jgi:hypothetical protein